MSRANEVKSTPVCPVALHVRVSRLAKVSLRCAQRFLYEQPKRVEWRAAKAIVLALRALNEPVPPNLQWAADMVDAEGDDTMPAPRRQNRAAKGAK